MSLPGSVQISIRDYQSRFIGAVVFPCFNTQAIDVCWGKIALIIFHPYVINRDLPLNARSAGPLNTHPSLCSARTQTSSLRLIHGWLRSKPAWEYGIWNCIKPLQLLFFFLAATSQQFWVCFFRRGRIEVEKVWRSTSLHLSCKIHLRQEVLYFVFF